MLTDLIDKELITHNYAHRKWTWDQTIFEGYNIAENVADL